MGTMEEMENGLAVMAMMVGEKCIEACDGCDGIISMMSMATADDEDVDLSKVCDFGRFVLCADKEADCEAFKDLMSQDDEDGFQKQVEAFEMCSGDGGDGGDGDAGS